MLSLRPLTVSFTASRKHLGCFDCLTDDCVCWQSRIHIHRHSNQPGTSTRHRSRRLEAFLQNHRYITMITRCTLPRKFWFLNSQISTYHFTAFFTVPVHSRRTDVMEQPSEFHEPDALPATQPIMSKHNRQTGLVIYSFVDTMVSAPHV